METNKSKLVLRITLPDEATLTKLEELETALILAGRNINEFWSDIIDEKNDEFVDPDTIGDFVNGAELSKAVEKKFNVRMTRFSLALLRVKATEGVDYFSAPNGNTKVFRYDLARCLRLFEEWRQKESETAKEGK